jgi:hypothetical protein
MFKLFCYVCGNHYEQAFEVKIAKEENLSLPSRNLSKLKQAKFSAMLMLNHLSYGRIPFPSMKTSKITLSSSIWITTSH